VSESDPKRGAPPPVPPERAEAYNRLGGWIFLHRRWRLISRTLTITIAGLSAYVASDLSQYLGRNYAALIVAVCAALQATLRPEQRANAFREAWIELDLALMEEDKIPAHLTDAIRHGENRIGETHAQSPSKNAQNSK
jgi:hypothetical protein